jgi:hypothetical protein
MDPLRSDMRPAEALSGTERDARIEQLLLAGLDEYFAHRYEHAINLWTRVLFLDRHHDRARAYIERARSAQGEVQRETEAVLYQGIEAFREGDVARARELVVDALDRGASLDEAQGMLDRIERLDAGQTAPKHRRRLPGSSSPTVAAVPRGATPLPKRVGGWVAGLLLIAAAVGTFAVGVWGWTVPEPSTWPLFAASSRQPRVVMPLAQTPLPIAAANEVFLTRARAQFAAGRLRDVLRELDRIPVGDPLRADADRLRADVQRQLLAVAAAEQPPE